MIHSKLVGAIVMTLGLVVALGVTALGENQASPKIVHHHHVSPPTPSPRASVSPSPSVSPTPSPVASSPVPTQSPVVAPAPMPVQQGDFSVAQIEALWVSVGGNPDYQATAACIAEHESGGNPNAVSPTDDYGLMQIHDDPAALDPTVGMTTAVSMSDDGTNWSPWTTAGDCGV